MRVFREIEYLPGNFFRSIVSKLLKKEIFRQAVEDESLGQGQMAEERPAQLALLQAWSSCQPRIKTSLLYSMAKTTWSNVHSGSQAGHVINRYINWIYAYRFKACFFFRLFACQEGSTLAWLTHLAEQRVERVLWKFLTKREWMVDVPASSSWVHR